MLQQPFTFISDQNADDLVKPLVDGVDIAREASQADHCSAVRSSTRRLPSDRDAEPQRLTCQGSY